MTRLFFISILLFYSFSFIVHSDNVRITMKNGTIIEGQIKKFDPISGVILSIAGQEISLKMDDVASITEIIQSSNTSEEEKNVDSKQSTVFIDSKNADYKLKYGAYEITDYNDYPDSIVINIGKQDLTMILVRGGWFNMGYDGRDSWSYYSEPIHKVNLSSFYVSKQYLTETAVNNLLGKTSKKESFKPKSILNWKKIQTVIDKIGNNYRLPTEAEWEYIAITPVSNIVFNEKKHIYEWVSDLFDEEYFKEEQTNPKGNVYGKEHVFRSFSKDNEKWKRYRDSFLINPDVYNKEIDNDNIFLRLAIDADKIVLNQ